MSTAYNTWVASLTTATLVGTETLPLVQSGVTKNATPNALATHVFTVGLPALPDSGPVEATDKFAANRANVGKSVLASAIATYATESILASAAVTPAAAGMKFVVNVSDVAKTLDIDLLAAYVRTGLQTTATNLTTLGENTDFAADDLLLVYDVTATAVGKKITGAKFETQVYADFAAYVAGTSPWGGITQLTDPAAVGTKKMYLTDAGTPKYVTPATMAAYTFHLGMATTADTLQTISAKTTPVAADSLLLLDSATDPVNEPKVVTLTNFVANHLDTRDTAISAGQVAGQASAFQLAKKINIITVSNSAGYAKLPNPTAWPMLQCTVINATGQTITLYGFAAETINGTAGATGITLTTGKSITLYTNGTNWYGQAAS